MDLSSLGLTKFILCTYTILEKLEADMHTIIYRHPTNQFSKRNCIVIVILYLCVLGFFSVYCTGLWLGLGRRRQQGYIITPFILLTETDKLRKLSATVMEGLLFLSTCVLLNYFVSRSCTLLPTYGFLVI